MSIANNAQIRFLHGTQSALNNMMSTGGQSGTFYLTNDTRRLYVGVDGGQIVPVNEGIVTYKTLPQANADNAGQFAYLEGNGILAVSNGSSWIHLNPNTDTTYTLKGISEGTGTGTITLTTQLMQNGVNTPIGTHAFKFTGENGVIIDIVNGAVTVYGVSIAATATSTSEFEIQLKDKNGEVVDTAEFKVAGALKVEDSEGKVKITNTAAILDGKIANVAPGAQEQGFTIKATAVDPFSASTVAQSGGKIDPKITIDGGNTKVPFIGGIADLTAAIENKITAAKHGFDAMTYKGTVTTLPTGSDIANGDTYKAASKFTFQKDGKAVQVEVGDLIIAQGSETDGAISGNINWEVVPSGNEDTTYSVVGSDTGIEIKEHAGGDTAGSPIGSLKITAGTNIKITRSGSGSTVGLTVNHDNIDCNKTTETGTTGGADAYNVSSNVLSMVSAETVSATGHVTAVTTKNWTVRDTNAKLNKDITSTVTTTTSGDTTSSTVELSATLERADNSKNVAKGNFSIKSTNKNLAIGADGTNVTVNLVWGTFGSN